MGHSIELHTVVSRIIRTTYIQRFNIQDIIVTRWNSVIDVRKRDDTVHTERLSTARTTNSPNAIDRTLDTLQQRLRAACRLHVSTLTADLSKIFHSLAVPPAD